MEKINFYPLAVLFIGIALTGCNNQTSDQDIKADADTIVTVPLASDSASSEIANLPESVNMVKEKLRAMYQSDLDKNLLDSISRTFYLDEFDLNNDGKKEIFVGHNGSYFCGSGGCTILILSPEGNLVTRFTVTGTPVIVEQSATRGWKDLLLLSSNRYHLLKYDGKRYPPNPSVQPAVKTEPEGSLPRLLNREIGTQPSLSF